LENLERRLGAVESALEGLADAETPVMRPEEPAPIPEPARAQAAEPAPAPAREPAFVFEQPEPSLPAPPPRPVRPRPRRELDWSKVLGAQALAWSGGAVSVLGVVFLFVLAVERGWIGPVARVSIGAVASVLLFGAGFWVRRRYGLLYAALGAVGAGIAGGYATLLAAAVRYDFFSDAVALVIAGVIAALGTAVALAWSAEIVAGVGLIGSLAVPALLAIDSGLTRTSLWFAAFVLGGAAVVAVARGWAPLLIAASSVSVVEIVVLLAQHRVGNAGNLALAATFWLVYFAAGIAWQLRRPAEPFGGLASALVVGSSAFAFYAAEIMFPGSPLHRGLVLLACGALNGVVGALLYRLQPRDLGALIAVLALALGAVGTADALSHGSLTYVWAAEAAALAWLARRVRDARFQLVALAYLVLAVVHGLVIDAPPRRLFVETGHPAAGAVSLVAIAAAGVLLAAFVARFEDAKDTGLLAMLAPVLDALRKGQLVVRILGATIAGLFMVDALSAGLLALYQVAWPGSVHNGFVHGHVGLTSMWAAAGVVVAVVAVRLRRRELAFGALAWLGVIVAKVLVFDLDKLPAPLYAWSLLASGAAVLAASLILEARARHLWPDPVVSIISVLASFALAVGGAVTLLEGWVYGVDLDAVALFGVAAVYALAAAFFFRREGGRNFSTLLWALALGAAGVAEGFLVGGQPRVLVWAATGAGLAWLARGVSERRFVIPAWTYLAVATAVSLGMHTTPAHFFVVGAHPARGLPSLLVTVAAIALAAFALRVPSAQPADELDAALDRRLPGLRRVSWWASGTLAVFAASLAILEVAERIGSKSATSNFQAGHAGVSALWGILGLALLYAGLRRQRAALRLGGFALFGVALGKLFLYDLAWLSSIARALSFMAVGAVLLLGGFFYQRLSAQLGERQKIA